MIFEVPNVRCPVCKSECRSTDKKCKTCGFSNPNVEFVSYADAEEWKETTLTPYLSIWKECQMQRAKVAALRIIYYAALSNHLKTAITLKNDQQYITDGYRILRYPASFKIVDRIFNHPDSERLITQATEEINLAKDYGVEVDLPPIELLEQLRNEQKNVYDFGDGKPLVNISYLIDMMEALPDAKGMCILRHSTSILCLYSEYGEGLLLPVNKAKHTQP